MARNPSRVTLVKVIEPACLSCKTGITSSTAGDHPILGIVPQTDLRTEIVHQTLDALQYQIQRSLQIETGGKLAANFFNSRQLAYPLAQRVVRALVQLRIFQGNRCLNGVC